MGLRWKLLLACCLILSIIQISASEAKNVNLNLGIIYQGEIFTCSGSIQEGRAFISLADAVQIFQAQIISTVGREVTILINNQKVLISCRVNSAAQYELPLRQMGEQIGMIIFWDKGTKTILFADYGPSTVLQDDVELIGRLIANDWMQAKSKEELFQYFVPLLTGQLLEQTVENCWEFVAQHTEWDAEYIMQSVGPAGGGQGWRAVAVELLERGLVENSEKHGAGLFVLRKDGSGRWRIAAMRYYWPDDKY